MNFETLKWEAEQGVCVIEIDRPKALNALNRQVLADLKTALEAFHGDESLHIVVLTGGGAKAFVAGADIREMANMSEAEALAFSKEGQEVVRLLALGSKISIAAVDGFALGGGCEMAAACDLIVGSTSSRFGQPEIKLGVIPGFGGTQRLTRRVGESRARYLVLTGEIVKGEEAHTIGLIDRLVEPGESLPSALKLARKMASEYSMAACRSAKKAIADGMGQGLEQALELEAKAFAACFTTEDQSEGMAAFMEKRLPKFNQ